MRTKLIALIAFGLLGLSGCSSCFGSRDKCGGEPSWWDRLTGRRSQPTEYVNSPMMAGAGCDCGNPGMMAEAEPILTAPQKLTADQKKDLPGYAEPMPFTPKKP